MPTSNPDLTFGTIFAGAVLVQLNAIVGIERDPARQVSTACRCLSHRPGRGAVQRELERLVESDLVTLTQGPSKRYQANRDAPVFSELRAIIEKTAGVSHVLRSALATAAACNEPWSRDRS